MCANVEPLPTAASAAAGSSQEQGSSPLQKSSLDTEQADAPPAEGAATSRAFQEVLQKLTPQQVCSSAAYVAT